MYTQPMRALAEQDLHIRCDVLLETDILERCTFEPTNHGLTVRLQFGHSTQTDTARFQAISRKVGRAHVSCSS